MLSLQEISDRLEIQDLVNRYAEIMDKLDKDLLLTDVFTEGALYDASVFGGPCGPIEEGIPLLKEQMNSELYPGAQHHNTNMQITLDGDEATGRITCLAIVDAILPEGDSQVLFSGVYYHDKYVRTPEGWRIKERIEELDWIYNKPDFLNEQFE